MTLESCLERAKNRVSYCCIRSSELRTGTYTTQQEAFVKANEEWKEFNKVAI